MGVPPARVPTLFGPRGQHSAQLKNPFLPCSPCSCAALNGAWIRGTQMRGMYPANEEKRVDVRPIDRIHVGYWSAPHSVLLPVAAGSRLHQDVSKRNGQGVAP